MRRPPALFALLLPGVLATLAGCAPRVERLTMEPLVIRVHPGGETTVVTADPLMDELASLQEDGRCDEALPRLQRFLEDFPESARFPEAVVRLGLCHESRREWEAARGYYRWAAERAHFDLALEAALRAAWCLEEMGAPERAAEEYARLAAVERAPDDARAGARLRRVVCLFRAGRVRRAAKELDRAIVAYSAVPDPSAPLKTAAAEARFAAAEEKGRRFSSIVLEYPQRTLDKRVGRKLAALTEARAAYLAVVQIKDAEWAAAAVCRVGELYEELYRALLAVPPPPGLTAPQQKEYAVQVAAKAKPLRQEAFASYLQVVALAERVGLESVWTARSRERVRALESELKSSVVSPDDEAPEPRAGPAGD